MRIIYHLVSSTDWQQTDLKPYAPESLASEGFVHCSNETQVETIANLFYAGADDLLVLCLDVAKLPEVRDETPEPNPFPGQTFPHVYGAIPREAVIAVRPLRRDAQGRWAFISV